MRPKKVYVWKQAKVYKGMIFCFGTDMRVEIVRRGTASKKWGNLWAYMRENLQLQPYLRAAVAIRKGPQLPKFNRASVIFG